MSPIRSTDGPPESPTTAQPLDFDSDEHETTATPTKPTQTETVPKPPPKDGAPPTNTKPAHLLSAREQAENTLKEAFPTIDPAVVRAVLTASGGRVEPAFNALLGMSDPDSQQEPDPPAMPPRPARGQPTGIQQSQLEADEMYARQLAEHYGNNARQQAPRQPNRYNEDLPPSRTGRPGAHPDPDDVPWRSFVDGEQLKRLVDYILC